MSPLEGLWWADDMDDFLARRKDNWRWRLLVNPDWIADAMIEHAKHIALTEKRHPAIPDVRSETLHEDTSAQVLHIGPYDAETPILTGLHHDYLPANNLRESGLHHEIYLSDPRRTAPAKLRTVLRQPVERSGGVPAALIVMGHGAARGGRVRGQVMTTCRRRRCRAGSPRTPGRRG